MKLDGLPLELILNILKWLNVEDILMLRQTSKALFRLTHERSVWFDAFYIHLVAKGWPVPGLQGRTVASLPATQLEALTHRALRYHRNWTSPSPQNRYEIEILPIDIPHEARPRCMSVHFLPGRNSDWVISLILQDQRNSSRTYMLQCWDISGYQPKCLALFTTRGLLSVVCNSDATHPAALSVTRRTHSSLLEKNNMRTTTTFAINPTAKDPGDGFRGLLSFASPRNPLALQGPFFFSVNAFDHVYVYNVDSGQLLYILRAPLLYDDPTARSEEFRCIRVLPRKDEGIVITFCQQWIHVYDLGEKTRSAMPKSQEPHELHPVAKYKWPYRIDRLDILVQPHHPLIKEFHSGVMQHRPGPICILVRFDSWFPWPVNILHQFVLPPNPRYHTRDDAKVVHRTLDKPRELPYLSDTSSARYSPYLVASIPSPVRLFTPSDMILGEYGTALWLDGQISRFSYAQVGDLGQRIAGQPIRFRKSPETEGDSFPTHAVDLQYEEDGTGDPEDLRVDGPGSSTRALATYQIDERNENWSKLAVSEQEGKIAVGCIDGRVLVFEYA